MKRILVVDDEWLIRKFFPRALSFEGVEVITAATMEEAKEHINSSFIDLVITDLSLDGSGGREGLEIISCAKSKLPACKVILMTGYGSGKLEKAAYEIGADFYMEKPVDISLLMDKAAEYCLLEENKLNRDEARSGLQ